LPDVPLYSSSWDADFGSFFAHTSSRILSENTKPLTPEEFVEQYTKISTAANAIPEKEYYDGLIVELPPIKGLQDIEVSLASCFKDRKTSRNFHRTPIELESVSTVLYAGFGNLHENDDEFTSVNLKNTVVRRSSPSATGLASCDAILWSNRIEGLEKGLYAYNGQTHSLHKHSVIMTEEELVYALFDQFWAKDLAAGIFVVHDLRRTWIKDISARGYISCYLEAGHISQNILLSATALKLNTWISGAFRDDILQNILHLPYYRFASLFIGMGSGTNEAIPKQYLEILEQQ
jgi:SagB-type dehydrogenase family enzyme